MVTAEYDLQYLETAASALEAYLLSRDAHWPLGKSAPAGEPPFPTLSVEGIVLAQKRLAAQGLSGAAAARRREVEAHITEVRTRWRAAWSQKATRAFHSRLHLWGGFIDELLHEPSAQQDRYPYEVRLRVMLDLLAHESNAIPTDELTQLAKTDLRLKARWKPGDFIWPAALEAGFPAGPYWYLYGRLVASKMATADQPL